MEDYIKDFTVDFTLKKDETYGTRLDVEENFTMVFPNYNEKHGPVRELFYTNQSGKNLIVEKAEKLDLEVLMDGSSFPIADTELGSSGADKLITYYIGRKSQYLNGEHTFTLKYHYVNVMLDDASSQDFYWNANGTGWSKTFESVTANVHIADADALASVLPNLTSCYVGKYRETNNGKNISDRCEVSNLEDGYSFTASNLAKGEGLTFAVDFKPNTYAAPIRKDSYVLVIAGALAALLMFGVIALFYRSYKKKAAEKRKFYKNYFVKPEYEPTRNLTVAEGEILMMKGAKKSYVATLLELAVSGKVKIVKGEPTKVLKKDTWKVEVISVDGITKSQRDMLELLNGGESVASGDTIEVKRRTATSHTASLARSYTSHAVSLIKEKGLKAKDGNSTKNTPGVVIFLAITFFVTFGCFLPIGAAVAFFEKFIGDPYANIIGLNIIPPILLVLYVATWIICTTISAMGSRPKWYTEEGLKVARELEGLKLYIDMAESDRLKFLQSVKGADTSSKGIVKLYEKLLPWAALFGAEESWLNELNKYYQVADYNPTWCGSPDLLNATVFSTVTRSISTNVAQAANYSSGGSGGGSGGFGGGGGGFSGGGGGGGGGGSW